MRTKKLLHVIFNVDVNYHHVFEHALCIVLMFVHLVFSFCLIWADVEIFAECSLMSAVFYVLGAVLSRKEKNQLAVYWIVYAEMIIFSILGSLYMGNTYSFFMYPFVLQTLSCLTQLVQNIRYLSGKEEKQHNILYAALLISLAVYMLDLHIGGSGMASFRAKFENEMPLLTLNILNHIIVFVGVIYGCIMIYHYASSYADKLHNNMEELIYLKDVAEEANRTKSAFLANMSHEIRTPMNAICGALALLKDKSMTPEQKEYVDVMDESTNHLLNIINDMLDFAKIDAKKFELVNVNYNVPGMLQQIEEMMGAKIKAKKLEFRIDVPGDMPFVISGDKERIRQIITNLLNNAVKYTEKGFVALRVYFDMPDRGTDVGLLHVSVEDTGKGIAEEDLEMVFDAFAQVDRQINNGVEGTGLGLAICKQLVLAMGGRIWVESELGKGSIFKMEIPQKIVAYQSAEPFTAGMDEAWKKETKTGSSNEGSMDLESIANGKTMQNAAANAAMRTGTGTVAQVDTDADSGMSGTMTGKTADRETAASTTTGATEEKKLHLVNTKILAVDDSKINLKVAKGLLTRLGAEVTAVECGQAAVNVLENGVTFDLVLMDYRMPGMDGVEATKLIRKLPHCGESELVIIAFSANTDDDATENFIEAGMQDVLVKPIAPKLLQDMLDKWLPDAKKTWE